MPQRLEVCNWGQQDEAVGASSVSDVDRGYVNVIPNAQAQVPRSTILNFQTRCKSRSGKQNRL